MQVSLLSFITAVLVEELFRLKNLKVEGKTHM